MIDFRAKISAMNRIESSSNLCLGKAKSKQVEEDQGDEKESKKGRDMEIANYFETFKATTNFKP
jgi:hypothetical protein